MLEIAGGIILAFILLPFALLALELFLHIALLFLHMLKRGVIAIFVAGMIYFLSLYLNPIIIFLLCFGVFIFYVYLGYTSNEDVLKQKSIEKDINNDSLEDDSDYDSVWGVDK